MRSQASCRDRRALALALAVAAIAVLAVTPAPAGASAVAATPGIQQVTLGVDKAEPGRRVSEGISVSRAASAGDADPATVYSVRLPRTERVQELLIRGVVAITRCDESDQRSGGGAHAGTRHSPCEFVRHPYNRPGRGHYDPRLGVRAYLGTSRSDLGHGIGAWQVRRCTIAVHHCPLELRTKLNRLPQRGGMWLNLAIAAFSPDARVGRRGRPVDVVELDGDCKHHDFNPDSNGDGNPTGDSRYCMPVLTSASSNTQGQLAAIRFGASRSPARPRVSRKLVNRQIRVQASRRVTKETRSRIILRERLRHLSPGDVVDAQARFHLRDHAGDGYVFRHEVGGLLFLSADPSALNPRTASCSPGRWISASARTNCPHRSGCEIHKVGAATVPASGPSTMWVTYVGSARDRHGSNGARTDVTAGRMSVAVDRAGSP